MQVNPIQTNKENFNPFEKQSKTTTKPNKFADWSQNKSLFLSSSITCDLLNEIQTPNPPHISTSLSSIDQQPSITSLLPPLELKTCTSFPVDYDLLDLGFIDQTPNSISYQSGDFSKNKGIVSKAKASEFSWMDFSDYTAKEEKQIKLITEDGVENTLSFKTSVSRPSLVSLLTNLGINLEHGFYLVDSQGKTYFLEDIPSLSVNSLYYAKSSSENLNVFLNLEEKSEKSRVEVDAFSHVEFLSALRPLQEGITLLKITKEGEAKFKLFQLNASENLIFWYSSHKLHSQTEVKLNKILEIKSGQRTKGFEKLGMNSLSSLSFSIKYLNESNDECYLDIICKERQEFDMVVTAIKGLSSSTKGEKLSKHVLLCHVKRFLIMIQEKKPFDCKELWDIEEKDSLRVEDFVVKRVSHEKDLFQALETINKKHLKLYEVDKGLIDEVMMKSKTPQQNLDEENIKNYYPKFCKKYVTLQKELCQFCNQDLPNLKIFLDFIQLRSIDITKDPLEEFLFNKRPEDKRNLQELEGYYNILNREIWGLGLDLENIKNFIERIKDRLFHKGKVDKLANKVEEKILDKFTEIGNVFNSFGKSLTEKIESLKEDFL